MAPAQIHRKKTINPPRVSIIMMMGSSQNFLRTRMKFHKSLKISIWSPVTCISLLMVIKKGRKAEGISHSVRWPMILVLTVIDH